MMRGLSFSQPWLWGVLDPVADKGIENRSWAPPIHMIGERIALHAAKSWDDSAIRYFIEFGIPHPGRKDLYASSCIVGVATIDRVVTESRTLTPAQRSWFFETRSDGKQNYGWILADRIKLREPVPCAGKQGLWPVPPDVEGQVLEQLARAA